jgi:hypothetical protein
MTRKLLYALAFVATAAFSQVAGAQADKTDKKPVDLTGKWTFTTQSTYGTSTPTVTITQKGDSLKGTYESQTLGTRGFSGTSTDGTFTFGFDAEAGGMQFSMSYAGKVEDDGSLSGSIEAAGSSFGTFTAVRQKKP